jgi:hypothetical protein
VYRNEFLAEFEIVLLLVLVLDVWSFRAGDQPVVPESDYSISWVAGL